MTGRAAHRLVRLRAGLRRAPPSSPLCQKPNVACSLKAAMQQRIFPFDDEERHAPLDRLLGLGQAAWTAARIFCRIGRANGAAFAMYASTRGSFFTSLSRLRLASAFTRAASNSSPLFQRGISGASATRQPSQNARRMSSTAPGEVPALLELVRRLVVVVLLVRLHHGLAESGLPDDVRALLHVRRRHPRLREVELVRAVEGSPSPGTRRRARVRPCIFASAAKSRRARTCRARSCRRRDVLP